MEISGNYRLFDSGAGEKLERFDAITLIRPSSLCVWKPRAAPAEWSRVHARFVPKRGWSASIANDATVELAGVKMPLRLQDNGQVGVFPEHALYLPVFDKVLSSKSCSVLNLFAYTGMASAYCLQRAAQVTHVELSKKAIEWAGETLALNALDNKQIKFIREDALQYVERELRRNKRYMLIIADPPSFSRVSDRQAWDLADVLAGCIENLVGLIADGGLIALTNHHYETGEQVLANLLSDAALKHKRQVTISTQVLKIDEQNSDRALPAGFLTLGQF